jgi:RNA polymerase sigma-70 factor (ECF subfamily)
MSSVLHSFAYNLTKNSEEAKDLFQETAYRAMTNREKFRPGTNFKAWLFTIMKNIFINNYRKKVKANTIIDSTDNMFYINSGKNVIANSGEANILMKELQVMIAKLDDGIKIPFMMHYEGFKYQEIADELSLPLGTVKSRIFFARKALKDSIQARYGEAILKV